VDRERPSAARLILDEATHYFNEVRAGRMT